jgi:predicted NBD/HSP70 family sugar kinase
LEKRGKKKWRRYVADVVERLTAALEPDDVVLGGGNVINLKELPKGIRVGNNNNAFLGGFRLWEKTVDQRRSRRAKTWNAKKRKSSGSKVMTGRKSAALKKAS